MKSVWLGADWRSGPPPHSALTRWRDKQYPTCAHSLSNTHPHTTRSWRKHICETTTHTQSKRFLAHRVYTVTLQYKHKSSNTYKHAGAPLHEDSFKWTSFQHSDPIQTNAIIKPYFIYKMDLRTTHESLNANVCHNVYMVYRKNKNATMSSSLLSVHVLSWTQWCIHYLT